MISYTVEVNLQKCEGASSSPARANFYKLTSVTSVDIVRNLVSNFLFMFLWGRYCTDG